MYFRLSAILSDGAIFVCENATSKTHSVRLGEGEKKPSGKSSFHFRPYVFYGTKNITTLIKKNPTEAVDVHDRFSF